MRYYTSTAGEMVLQAGIAPSDTTITVDTTAGLPGSYPYTLLIDYGTTAEEIVDVTAVAGTTLTVTRGRDGTVAQSHAFGAKIRHGISARDLRESREHEAATSAHGVGAVVGLTETQTLDNKTFSPATNNTAATFKARAGSTEPVTEYQDSGGVPVGTITETGVTSLTGATTWASLYWGAAVSAFKSILSLRIDSDIHGVVGNVIAGATGRFLRLMSGATELFYVSAAGALKATAATIDGNASVGGTLSGPTITSLQSADTNLQTSVTSLQNADTALGNRVTTLESKTASVMRSTFYKFSDASTLTYGSPTAAALGARGGEGTFVAPPSGVVDITSGGQLAAGSSGQYTAVGFEVRATNVGGAVVRAYDVDDSAANMNVDWVRTQYTTQVTGLTPGATYYVRQMAASATAGGRIAQGRLRIEPQL